MADNLNEQLAALNRLYKEQDDVYRGVAQRAGLSETAFILLYFLCEADSSISQHELCELCFYPKQTVNSSIAKLVKDGLVHLRPLAGYRNRKAVELTADGRDFCQQYVFPMLAAEQHAFARFTPEERVVYLKLFRQYIDSLREEIEI